MTIGADAWLDLRTQAESVQQRRIAGGQELLPDAQVYKSHGVGGTNFRLME